MRRRYRIAAGLDRSSEDSVYKLGRGFTAEKFAQLNRLVDRGPERHCSIAVQGFIESDAQYVAVNRGHLRERPQRRPQLNQAIDGGAIGQHAAHQLLGVVDGLPQDLVWIWRRRRFAG